MIHVLIVDDLRFICEALKAMFMSEKDLKIVGFAHDGQEALEQVAEKKPDVVLIDILMPLMGGIKTTEIITQKFPDTKVIVLTTFEEDTYIIDSIAAGAKGYLLKDMPALDLASAIRAVHGGGSQMAPGIIEKLANKFSRDVPIQAQLSPTKVSQPPALKPISQAPISQAPALEALAAQALVAQAFVSQAPTSKPISQALVVRPKGETKKTKANGEKPLFRYGDWISLAMGIVILSQLPIPGMGHHLGHAGLIFLMLALIARPIRFFWDFPLRHRRTIGILAFAFSLAHVICATQTHLGWNLASIFSMSFYHQLGMWAGIFSLIAMTPAAITSFQYLQRKLGKRWKQIHLLTVPSLILALLHTLLIGPHYMSEFSIQGIDLLRAIGISLLTLSILLMRRRLFWSLLGLNKMKTPKQTPKESKHL